MQRSSNFLKQGVAISYFFPQTNGKTFTDNRHSYITFEIGKWVKYKEAGSGHYLWVILAPDGRIMEFDRDIVWSFFRGGRVNELWLRDEWLSKRIIKK